MCVIHWLGRKWEPQNQGAELGGGVCPSVSVRPMASLCPRRVRLMAHQAQTFLANNGFL